MQVPQRFLTLLDATLFVMFSIDLNLTLNGEGRITMHEGYKIGAHFEVGGDADGRFDATTKNYVAFKRKPVVPKKREAAMITPQSLEQHN